MSTESGPTMGRSGENRVADGAPSGRDISEAMCAGLDTMTIRPGPPANSDRKTSPYRSTARKITSPSRSV
ncbi:hypothetical protein [Tsukamurella conjunctivitidis]|uniref:hypothetical protein n=1 Tax=Tsukamurella conjunctivitidis TaxID=2592068 RepID=UPI001E3F16A5|nr:hypothetical protein [Tsukamurella conjunctivitidis]